MYFDVYLSDVVYCTVSPYPWPNALIIGDQWNSLWCFACIQIIDTSSSNGLWKVSTIWLRSKVNRNIVCQYRLQWDSPIHTTIRQPLYFGNALQMLNSTSATEKWIYPYKDLYMYWLTCTRRDTLFFIIVGMFCLETNFKVFLLSFPMFLTVAHVRVAKL